MDVEKRPLKFAEARKPPRRTGRKKKVIDAVPIKIAYAVLSEGVDVEKVTRVDRDVVLGVEVDGVVLLFVCEDVLRDAGEFARLSPDMDRIVLAVLEGISEVQELKAGVAAQVATPPAAASVNVENMGVRLVPGPVIAAALEHQVSLGYIAAAVEGSGDCMAVEVESVAGNLGPRAVTYINAISTRCSLINGDLHLLPPNIFSPPTYYYVVIRLLVVMEEIVVDSNLVGVHDHDVRTDALRPVIASRYRVVLNRNTRTAPASDFHIRDLDINASQDAYADFVGRLITEVRSVQTEARDTDASVLGFVLPAFNLKEGRCDDIDRVFDRVFDDIAALAVSKHRPPRLRRPGFGNLRCSVWPQASERGDQAGVATPGRRGGWRWAVRKGADAGQGHAWAEAHGIKAARQSGEIDIDIWPEPNGCAADQKVISKFLHLLSESVGIVAHADDVVDRAFLWAG